MTVNGVRSGYAHRNRENSAAIVTRVDVYPNQSYLIWLGDNKHLTHCGQWHAPRLPAFPIGVVNPPFLLRGDSSMSNADDGVASTLMTRPEFIEFYTVKGRKVTASW